MLFVVIKVLERVGLLNFMSLNLLAKEEADLTPPILDGLKKGGHNNHSPHVLYFGHEFFHFFRAKKQEFKTPPQNDKNYTLVWLLDQIENEGIADQINVKQLYWGDAPLAGTEKAKKELKDREKAAGEITAFSDILAGIADHPEWKYGLSKQARKIITRSGHVAGFYMANTILENFDKAELVAVVRNPFKFFYLYNKAASLDGDAPQFSDKAISVIKDIESKCSLTENSTDNK